MLTEWERTHSPPQSEEVCLLTTLGLGFGVIVA